MILFGFRARLSIAMSVLIGSIGVFFAVYVPAQHAAIAEQAMIQRARGLAQVLSRLVAPSVEFESVEDAQLQLSSLGQDQDLNYVVLAKRDGTIFSRYSPSDATAASPELVPTVDELRHQATDEALLVYAPLTFNEARIGSLALSFSRAAITNSQEVSQRNAILVGLLIVAFGLVAAVLITRPLVGTAHQLAKLSDDLVAAARDQESTAAQESAAVEETRRSMDTLLRSAQEIAERSSEVLGNSERSMSHNRAIADRIDDLSAMLESIMQIADKTDLLALNAALEGTRAGEAGKGFTLVAAEMRRLAENVMDTASQIRDLTKDMHAASETAVEASRVGTVSSEKIALLTQQQTQATAAVVRSMDEMTRVLGQTLEGIQRSTASAATLADLSRVLTGMIDTGPTPRSRPRNGVMGPGNSLPGPPLPGPQDIDAHDAHDDADI
jgi:hypothetical protein